MQFHVTYEKDSGKDARKLYFSTDVSMNPADILFYYQSRYQIEFLYRDGKQHTFSMSNIKTMNHNILLLNRFYWCVRYFPILCKKSTLSQKTRILRHYAA